MTPVGPVAFAEVFTAALAGDGCSVVDGIGAGRRLPVHRWLGEVDAFDRALLAHCVGRTLDVGCGPGRMTAHLTSLGVAAAGLDVVADAVARTRARGATCFHGDVFDPVPLEGRWQTALLADGNIGIGGDPVRLLARLRELLVPGGRVVADLAPPGAGVRRASLTIRTDRQHSRPFPWAIVGADAVGGVAEAAGLVVRESRQVTGRWFALLEARP